MLSEVGVEPTPRELDCDLNATVVNSLVKNRLFKIAPDIDEPPFQFIHTMDLSVVDTMLHDSPDLVIHNAEVRSGLFGGHGLGARKVGVS